MKYGCIGEHLSHSFSKEIHNALADYEYELKEIPRDELDAFAEAKSFDAINVTIPYKEQMIPHLYEIDAHAKEIGAVNTVVNRGGRLYGYNTDFFGMSELIKHAGIMLKNRKVIILGTGGTSKTAEAVATSMGAASVTKVSRDGKCGAITYDELYRDHGDTEIIINTTPVGMFPDVHTSPIDPRGFRHLSGVIDAVYNPIRTKLISDALALGIPAEGGLYMLVAQAVRASEIFLDTKYQDNTTEEVYKKIFKEKQNIVLIGMPASGKTTVGKILSSKLGRKLLDTDRIAEELVGMSIPQMFKTSGESAFRDTEAEAVKQAAAYTGAVIATGGGAILRQENVEALKRNGRLFFIDRPLEALLPTEDRPLASNAEAIRQRYNERYSIYTECADVRIDADTSAEAVAEKIISEIDK